MDIFSRQSTPMDDIFTQGCNTKEVPDIELDLSTGGELANTIEIQNPTRGPDSRPDDLMFHTEPLNHFSENCGLQCGNAVTSTAVPDSQNYSSLKKQRDVCHSMNDSTDPFLTQKPASSPSPVSVMPFLDEFHMELPRFTVQPELKSEPVFESDSNPSTAPHTPNLGVNNDFERQFGSEFFMLESNEGHDHRHEQGKDGQRED